MVRATESVPHLRRTRQRAAGVGTDGLYIVSGVGFARFVLSLRIWRRQVADSHSSLTSAKLGRKFYARPALVAPRAAPVRAG